RDPTQFVLRNSPSLSAGDDGEAKDQDRVKRRGKGGGGGEEARIEDDDDDDDDDAGALLHQTVLHLQSPTIATTFIRSPPFSARGSLLGAQTLELAIPLPFVHFQFRPLGRHLPFLVEVGLKDARGQHARIRASSFQTTPALYPAEAPVKGYRGDDGDDEDGNGRQHHLARELSLRRGPLLHLPIDMPSRAPLSSGGSESRVVVLTTWSTLSLHLSHLLGHFNNASLIPPSAAPTLGRSATVPIPQTFYGFQYITYVQVHANCRLRRIWCDEGAGETGRDEFRLFTSTPSS
ncbi:hypothetical protein FA10DRAFT_269663, partial [Acaromyces ingoldii]